MVSSIIARAFISGFVSGLVFVAAMPVAESKTDASPHRAPQFSFLFVGGFGNELGRSNYFSENILAVREMGAALAEAYFPPSLQSVEKNTDGLKARILELHERGGGRPVIVVGHSKGGLETLATLLRFPELVRERVVDQAILIQAPLGGNTLFDERGRWGQWLVKLFSVAPGFRSLRSAGIQTSIADRLVKLSEVDEDFRRISRSVSYVVTEKPSADSAQIFRFQSLLPRTLFPAHVPNDGLIATADMAIPGFGSVLARLTADHLETVLGRNVRFLVDNVDRDSVHTLTKTLVASALSKKRAARVLSSTCESLFLSTSFEF